MQESKFVQIDALSLLLKNKRFDCIYKYLYAKHHDDPRKFPFYKWLYCEHIRAFNGFYEEYPETGATKNCAQDFIDAFEATLASIKANGFDAGKSVVPVDINGELLDASHRVSICAVLGLPVQTELGICKEYYDYKFFSDRKLPSLVADTGALEYVKLNPNAYIVQIHAANSISFDSQIESILSTYGTIYYKKNVHLNLNGYTNLKIMSYGSEDQVSWVGSYKDGFAGARDHARQSYGRNPLRAYVFVAENLDDVVRAKACIRKLLNIGNYSVHINDEHAEAVAMAQTLFNDNSIFILNNRSYNLANSILDVLVDSFKVCITACGSDIDDYCIGGATPLAVLGVRGTSDLDYLTIDSKPVEFSDPLISDHASESDYYGLDFAEIITNPIYHFYYRGIKVISLAVLKNLKCARHEFPKDYRDIIYAISCQYLKAASFWRALRSVLRKG